MAQIILTPNKIVVIKRHISNTYTQDINSGYIYDNKYTYSYTNTNYAAEDPVTFGFSGVNATSHDEYNYRYWTKTRWENVSLLSFDLSSVQGTITAAVLRLYPTSDYASTGAIFNVLRNTSNFEPTAVVFATKPMTTAEAQIANVTITQNVWNELNVTSMVQSMVAVGNYGFTLNASAALNYAKKLAKTGATAPQLVITYTPNSSTIATITPSIEMDGVSTGNITINTGAATYTHNLLLSLGAYSQNISMAAGETSRTFSIPTEWCNAIPNSTTGTITATLTTYNGGNVIGQTNTKTLSGTVPASIVPTIETPVLTENTSQVASQFSVYIQGRSTINFTANVSGVYTSTIRTARLTINGQTLSTSDALSEVSLTTGTLTSGGAQNYTLIITDSRGRTASYTGLYTVVAYANPAISTLTATRSDVDGTEIDSGAYAKITLAASISGAEAQNTRSATVYYKKVSDNTWNSMEIPDTDWTNYTLNVTRVMGNGNISVDYSYDIRLTITDYFGSVSIQTVLPGQAFILDVSEDGTHIGFGKAADATYRFDFNGTTILRDDQTLNAQLILSGADITSQIYNDDDYLFISTDAANGVSFNAPLTVDGSILPNGTTHDLGGAAAYWSSIYGGKLNLLSADVTSSIGSDNAYYLNFATDSTSGFYFNRQLSVNGNVVPGGNSTHDLGSTSLYWKNLYLAGYLVYSKMLHNGELEAATALSINVNGAFQLVHISGSIATAGGDIVMYFNGDEADNYRSAYGYDTSSGINRTSGILVGNGNNVNIWTTFDLWISYNPTTAITHVWGHGIRGRTVFGRSSISADYYGVGTSISFNLAINHLAIRVY